MTDSPNADCIHGTNPDTPCAACEIDTEAATWRRWIRDDLAWRTFQARANS
jgi:hypothetical protein